MSEDIKRKLFGAVIAFDTPYESQISIAARDVEHAKELLTELFKDRENLRIIDVFDLADIAGHEVVVEALDVIDIPNKDQLN